MLESIDASVALPVAAAASTSSLKMMSISSRWTPRGPNAPSAHRAAREGKVRLRDLPS
jgi:hypothetical protein